MFGLGGGELVLIGFAALIFIGPKKLPELAKSLGKGIREFQKAKDDIMDDISVAQKVEDNKGEQENNATRKIVKSEKELEKETPLS